MIDKIINLAWGWFKSNIKLPFDQDKLKEQALDIAYNQGLTGLVSSLEQMVPNDKKANLNHPMWQGLKQASESGDAAQFVQQAGIALKNSGQADEIMKHIRK